MEVLRTGVYQPFTAALVERHLRLIVLCLAASLPCLLLLPEGRLRAAGAVLAVFLVLLAVFDGHYGFLHDRLLLPLGGLGLALEALGLLPWGVAAAAAAAAAAGGAFFLLRFISRGGLGWGDVKFAAVLGLWLGGRGTLVAVSLAVLLGGILSAMLLLKGWGSKRAVPFGPFLSAGAYVSYIWGGSLWQWYWGALL